MAIAPIPPISPVAVASPSVVGPVAPSQGAGFQGMLDEALAVEKQANAQALRLAAGDFVDVHQFTAAAARAQLTVEMTAAVRNRAVDAFNEIMRMQV